MYVKFIVQLLLFIGARVRLAEDVPADSSGALLQYLSLEEQRRKHDDCSQLQFPPGAPTSRLFPEHPPRARSHAATSQKAGWHAKGGQDRGHRASQRLTANWAVQLSLHKRWSLPCKRRASGTVVVPDSSSQSHKVTEGFRLAAAGTAAAGPTCLACGAGC